MRQYLVRCGYGPVKLTSNGYRCYCPCHDDTGRPNLDISVVDNKILMHCKSCGANGLDVIKKLKLKSDMLQGVYMSPKNNFQEIWKKKFRNLSSNILREFAKKLESKQIVLKKYGCYYDEKLHCLCYPERDYDGNVIGIVSRNVKSKKIALKHSKRGLVVPLESKQNPCLYITEGASDCFALSWLLKSHIKGNSYQVIARPNKTSGRHKILLYVHEIKPERIIVCADADDNEGVDGNGVESIACDLRCLGYDVDIIRPPEGIKDIREWITKGAKKADFIERIEA